MNTFIVDPFPNEHVFSWLLRMFRLSGYRDFATYQKSLGIDDKFLHSYKVFSPATEILISFFDDRDHAIKTHTNIPVWQIAVGTVILGNDHVRLDSFNHMNEKQSFGFDTNWHSCKACRISDREKYGTTYWHAPHQLTSVFECYKHQCMLEKAETPIINLFKKTFPHEVKKWIPLLDKVNDDLKNWQSFYIYINELAKTHTLLTSNIKAHLSNIFGLDGKLIVERKEIGKELNQQFISALGSALTSYLFREYSRPQDRPEVNIVNLCFTNFQSIQGERHPIFLAALAYWQRSALNI
jgi:hypothetical protein